MEKLLSEAEAEVEISAQIMEYYVKHAASLLAPRTIESIDPAVKKASIVNEPLGVLLAIEPWNFPYYQIARILSPQLSAGIHYF
ncbi:aldehyde dehydrogenase family protein [Vibrio sp. PP-XX7]